MTRGPAVAAGPLRLWGRLALPTALACLPVSACAGAARPAPGSPEAAPPDVVEEATRLPEADVAPVREEWEAGRVRAAAVLAESLYAVRRGRPGAAEGPALWLAARLWEEAAGAVPVASFEELHGAADPDRLLREGARRLAAAKAALAEEPDAIRALLRVPDAVDGRHLDLVRDAAGRLSLRELEALSREGSAATEALAAVRVALARALALAGRPDSAAAVARAVEGVAEGGDLRLARSIAAGEVRPDTAPLRVGAVLPLTGGLASVGALLREGVELAVARAAEAPGEDGRRVELIVLDDGSRAEDGGELVRELERRGVTAIVGPVRSEGLSAAAAAREYRGLLLVSPTATETGGPWPHAYTLWARERREADASRDLGRWLAGELGVGPLGVLHPEGAAGERSAASFREGAEEAGGRVVAAVAYPPDSTTFEGPVTALAAAAPAAVYVAADGPRTVLQLVPQLSFYGLRAVIVAGGPAWSEPEVVRRLDPAFADHRVVATFVDRVSPSSAWAEFQARYERRYRKALPDSFLPALAYDAVGLVLDGMPAEGPAPPGAVARAARAGALEGATGALALDPATSTVARRTLVRMIVDRQLVPADPARLLAWAEEARRLEEARLEAVRRQDEGGRAPLAPGGP